MHGSRRDGSRRTFLKSGAVALGAGWPLQHAWSTEGADQGALKMVFFTDVHSRTEYDTPVALARAAEAINAQQPDLILAGGDLITDGFQAPQGGVDDRWDAYLKMHRALRGDVHAAIGNHDLVAARPDDGSAAASDPRAPFREHLGVPRTYRSYVDEWHRWRGTTFVTGGAVCGKWWRGPWYGTEEGFGVLTLRPDHVDWRYVDYGWAALRP